MGISREEYDNQKSFFEWVELHKARYPQLRTIWHPANEFWVEGTTEVRGQPVKKGALLWGKLKAVGARPGTWDIHVDCPGWVEMPSGDIRKAAKLYIEMKSGTGELTKSQKDFRRDILGAYEALPEHFLELCPVFVECQTWDEAARLVCDYFNLKGLV